MEWKGNAVLNGKWNGRTRERYISWGLMSDVCFMLSLNPWLASVGRFFVPGGYIPTLDNQAKGMLEGLCLAVWIQILIRESVCDLPPNENGILKDILFFFVVFWLSLSFHPLLSAFHFIHLQKMSCLYEIASNTGKFSIWQHEIDNRRYRIMKIRDPDHVFERSWESYESEMKC